MCIRDRVTVLGMQAVDCLGKDLGTGGLAGAAHAGKQISVAQDVYKRQVTPRTAC